MTVPNAPTVHYYSFQTNELIFTDTTTGVVPLVGDYIRLPDGKRIKVNNRTLEFEQNTYKMKTDRSRESIVAREVEVTDTKVVVYVYVG